MSILKSFDERIIKLNLNELENKKKNKISSMRNFSILFKETSAFNIVSRNDFIKGNDKLWQDVKMQRHTDVQKQSL